MANTSYLFPVINTEKDSSGNINSIKYQLFLPQNKLKEFSSSYIKKNEDRNMYNSDKLQKNNVVYTKYDMQVSSSSYLKYKLKYYEHSVKNKSSYTDFILGSDKSFMITIKNGGKNYTKDSYNIKIYTDYITNNKTCWLCYSKDNSYCNECNKILDIPVYAHTLNGKIDSIEILPYYIANNKLVDNTKLLYKKYNNLQLVIPLPEKDITTSIAKLSLDITQSYNQKHMNIIPRESGLNSSIEMNYRNKHNRNDFNILIKKKNKKIYRFLYQQSLSQQKIQENYSILNKIDNNNFNPRIRFKKSTQKIIDFSSSNSLRGLSQSSLLSIKSNNIIDNTRQVNINYSIPCSQYLKDKILENNRKLKTKPKTKTKNTKKGLLNDDYNLFISN